MNTEKDIWKMLVTKQSLDPIDYHIGKNLFNVFVLLNYSGMKKFGNRCLRTPNASHIWICCVDLPWLVSLFSCIVFL